MSQTDKRDMIDAEAETLAGLLRQHARAIKLGIRVAAPAQVVSYTAATQTANLLLGTLTVEDRGLPTNPPDPPLQLGNVPVAFPRGLGGLAYDTLPIVPGDTGMVICCDRNITQWRALGVPADPLDGEACTFAGAVFYPGLHPDTAPITPPPSTTARVIEAPLINIGVGAVDFALRGTSLVTSLNVISGVLNAVPAAADPATVITLANANKAAIIAAIAAIASSLSTKVRIQ